MKNTSLKPTIVFVSTYPPRECGIATFTRDLATAFQSLVLKEATVKIAAINRTSLDSLIYPAEVAWQIDQDTVEDYRRLAQQLNDDPTVKTIVIQHEYGIFGGPDGEHITEFTKLLTKPYIISMHTVLSKPSNSLKEVTEKLIRDAATVIVLSQESRTILMDLYNAPAEKVQFVPHGIHPQLFLSSAQVKPKLKLSDKTVITTFGLLSRGKGIEYVIRSLPEVVEKHPDLLYLVLGQTHPVIRKSEGESYRHELMELVSELGLEKHVTFYDHYLSTEDILIYLQATDIYVATSLSPEQSVSGTFSYALGAGRAVISTAFRQANEVITPDVGRLVPMKDSTAYSNALLELLANPHTLHLMHQEAYRQTRSMVWSNVAHEYSELLAAIPGCELPKQWYAPEFTAKHIDTMTDHFGLLQFGSLDKPNPEFGYTLDDNARALIVLLKLVDQNMLSQLQAMPLVIKYFQFILLCRQKDGSFINYLSGDDQTRTGQNTTEDLSDCVGRACWALGEVSACEWLPENIRAQAEKILIETLPVFNSIRHLRSRAFAGLGVARVATNNKSLLPSLSVLMDPIVTQYHQFSSSEWDWFEESLTYANGMLPMALFEASKVLNDSEMLKVGQKTLGFLTTQCFFGDMYIPIGQRIWSNSDGTRGFFDQQPEDPASMMLALTEAYRNFNNEEYARLARKCFSWFLGNNIIGKRLYNPLTGGCHDGLNKGGVNGNQGAESLISYLFARWAVELL